MSLEIANAQTRAGVAIIGYGAAGVNCAIALRCAGYKGPIRVFSNHATLPYSPILTSYYAGGERIYEECFPWTETELDELDLEVLESCPVEALDPAAHLISTPRGDYPYEKALIATGASPATWGYPEDAEAEPLVLRTMDDAERLREALSSDAKPRVLVSGASMVALKALEAALRRGAEVSLVGVNPHILDFNALPETAARFERGLAAKGVTMRFGTKIESVKSAETGNSYLVTFANGEAEEVDLIVVAHGVTGNLGFVPDGALARDKGLLVDRFMRTSDPDVYAAGDVAQATELTTGEARIVGIWKNAALQGATAGKAMAAELAGREPDEADAFKGSISMNTIAVDGTLFISAGASTLGNGRRAEIDETEDMTVARIYERTSSGEERLVGFNLTCDEDVEGSRAYDTGAMLTLRIERSLGLDRGGE